MLVATGNQRGTEKMRTVVVVFTIVVNAIAWVMMFLGCAQLGDAAILIGGAVMLMLSAILHVLRDLPRLEGK